MASWVFRNGESHEYVWGPGNLDNSWASSVSFCGKPDKAAGQWLAQQQGIHHVTIDTDFSDEASEFCSELAQSSSISRVNASFHAIGTESAMALAASTRITDLALCRTDITETTLHAVCTKRGLVSLTINACYQTLVIPDLSTSIKTLKIDRGCINDEDARKITNSGSLTSLHLHNNNIRNEGALALAKCTSLTALDIGWNHIGNEAVKGFALANTLKDLQMDNSPFVMDMLGSMAGNTSVTRLDVLHNYACWGVPVYITSNTMLKSLRIEQPLEDLCIAVAGIPSLTSLMLGTPHVGETLAKTLRNNTTLREVFLSSDGLTREAAIELTGWDSLYKFHGRMDSVKNHENERMLRESVRENRTHQRSECVMFLMMSITLFTLKANMRYPNKRLR